MPKKLNNKTIIKDIQHFQYKIMKLINMNRVLNKKVNRKQINNEQILIFLYQIRIKMKKQMIYRKFISRHLDFTFKHIEN
jgi:hypothetical protein